MLYLTLQSQAFKNIHMLVNFPNDIEVKLKGIQDFKVQYGDNNSECVAKLMYGLEYTDPTQFELSVECHGRFICEGIVDEDSKKAAHIKAYELLFPYVQNKIAQLTVDAGMPPIFIKMEKMEASQVQILDDKE